MYEQVHHLDGVASLGGNHGVAIDAGAGEAVAVPDDGVAWADGVAVLDDDGGPMVELEGDDGVAAVDGGEGVGVETFLAERMAVPEVGLVWTDDDRVGMRPGVAGVDSVLSPTSTASLQHSS